MESGVITEDQSKKILTQWAENKDVTFENFSISPLTNQLDGLIGEQFFLQIIYNEAGKQSDVRFFVKILPVNNPIMYKVSREMLAYEKEAFFYETFVPDLKSCGLKCDYLAKSYFCDCDAVVLEDLTQLSYRGSGKTGSLDVEHCYACLKTIARFHADGIIFQLKKSNDFAEYNLENKCPDVLKETLFNDNSLVNKYYTYSAEGISNIADLIFGNKNTDFKKKLMETIKNFKDNELLKKYKRTLTHNDLWANNFLYKYDENDKITCCKIIDFQTLALKPPAVDVVAFLFLNTRREFRDRHLTDFLNYYYKCFSEFMGEEGFNSSDVLSEDEFYTTCDIFMGYVKIHSTIDRSLTQIPEDVFIEAAGSDESFSHFLFEGRPKYMMDVFNTNENYRDIMTEDITELISLLLD